jgi:hypothetical protein
MLSGAIRVYILLGVCLAAIILIIAVVSHSSTAAVEIEAINAINNPGPKKIDIESSGVHNTNTLVEGDVSLDLHGSTIAALVLGTVILVATITLSSVKILSWKRKYATNSRYQPPPAAPYPPGIPLAPITPHPALHHDQPRPRPSAPYLDPPMTAPPAPYHEPHGPRPSAPYQDPHTPMQRPSAPYPDAKEPSPGDPATLSALEIAVAKMISRDKDNVYHSPLSPGTSP